MQTFYFPVLWLIPEFDADTCQGGRATAHKRKWEVSIFDLYSLTAQKHPIRLPAELMHIFLQNVNLEFSFEAENFEKASDYIDVFRAMLYLRHTVPTVSPFASNFSINEYAGINDRSSGGQSRMHAGLREGITHKTSRVETWVNELSFKCIQGGNSDELTPRIAAGVVDGANRDLDVWLEIEKKRPETRAARRAFVKAPLMPDLQSSILQIWQGLEGLFPSISTEITFRTSLLLAELTSPLQPRLETYEASKKSYADRSRIAHGSTKPVDMAQWLRAWRLLRDALQAILIRGRLPTEEELTQSLLEGGGISPENKFT